MKTREMTMPMVRDRRGVDRWPCLQCGKPLRPNFSWKERRVEDGNGGHYHERVKGNYLGSGHQNRDHFCGPKCAAAYSEGAVGRLKAAQAFVREIEIMASRMREDGEDRYAKELEDELGKLWENFPKEV